MTTFAARLVARHAAPPAVRPRARSRFEQEMAWSGSATPLPEVTVTLEAGRAGPEGAASRTPATATPLATRRSNEPRGARTQVRADEPGAPSVRRPSEGEPAAAVPRPTSSPLHPPSEPTPSAPVRPEPVAPLPSRLPDARPAAARRAVATQALVRLEPDRPAAKAEPDVVHVHISRVEVRGGIASSEPARRPAMTMAGVPGPLDLERYLAGERRR